MPGVRPGLLDEIIGTAIIISGAVAITTFSVWWLMRRPEPIKAVKPGHCLNCDYNLTGLPEPRCPECGQPFEAKGDAK